MATNSGMNRGAPPVEIIRLSDPSFLSKIAGANQHLLKAAFIVLLTATSSVVVAKIRLDIAVNKPLINHAGAILWSFVSGFVLLQVFLAIPGTVLFDANSAYLKLTLPGLLHVIAALWHWYCGLTCLFFACNLWTLSSLKHFVIGSMVGGLGLKILPWGSRSFALAKRHMMRPARELLRADSRDPILYLRPFIEDDAIPPEESVRDYDTGGAQSKFLHGPTISQI